MGEPDEKYKNVRQRLAFIVQAVNQLDNAIMVSPEITEDIINDKIACIQLEMGQLQHCVNERINKAKLMLEKQQVETAEQQLRITMLKEQIDTLQSLIRQETDLPT